MNFRDKLHLPSRIAVLAAVILCGCAHYSSTQNGKIAFHTLYVAPVKNSSSAPQAQAPVTEMVRQALLQQGSVTLASQHDADVTLDIILTNYQRTSSAVSSTNTLNSQSYDATLTATCTLVDNRDGKVYFKDRPVSVTLEAYVLNGDSISESEYQTMTKLAREMGRKISDTVVGVW